MKQTIWRGLNSALNLTGMRLSTVISATRCVPATNLRLPSRRSMPNRTGNAGLSNSCMVGGTSRPGISGLPYWNGTSPIAASSRLADCYQSSALVKSGAAHQGSIVWRMRGKTSNRFSGRNRLNVSTVSSSVTVLASDSLTTTAAIGMLWAASALTAVNE